MAICVWLVATTLDNTTLDKSPLFLDPGHLVVLARNCESGF